MSMQFHLHIFSANQKRVRQEPWIISDGLMPAKEITQKQSDSKFFIISVVNFVTHLLICAMLTTKVSLLMVTFLCF